MAATHRYSARCSWSGDTGLGYEGYDRSHVGRAPPSPGELFLSADPAFRGSPERLNPEQLLLLAASSCQLLAFLAVAARARVEVLRYDDEAEAVMPEDDTPVRITAITLRPRIEVAAGTSVARIEHLCEVAHRECYIANSLATPVEVRPIVTTGGGSYAVSE